MVKNKLTRRLLEDLAEASGVPVKELRKGRDPAWDANPMRRRSRVHPEAPKRKPPRKRRRGDRK